MRFKSFLKFKSNTKLKKSSISPWHETNIGRILIAREQKALSLILPHLSGNYLINISNISILGFLSHSPIKRKMLLSNNINEYTFRIDDDIEVMQCDYDNLPLSPNSIDVAIIYHTLEFTENFTTILNETSLALKTNGKLIIFGFNPWSWFGIKQLFIKKNNHTTPLNFACAKFIFLPYLYKQLFGLGFSIEKIDTLSKKPVLKNILQIFRLSYKASYLVIANKDELGMSFVKSWLFKRNHPYLRYLRPSIQTTNQISQNTNE